MDILQFYKEKMKLLDVDERFMNRSVNEGSSGGEKKRNEILQMALLEPDVAILDETDSGLDIDALGVVGGGIDRVRAAHASALVSTRSGRRRRHDGPDPRRGADPGRLPDPQAPGARQAAGVPRLG